MKQTLMIVYQICVAMEAALMVYPPSPVFVNLVTLENYVTSIFKTV